MKKPHAPPSWTLSGSLAGRADVTIDLTDPAAGLALGASEDRLLGIDLAAGDRLTPSDTWLRGDDLVAVYDLDDRRQVRASAMWRWLAGPPAAWEVVVSASTSLLESDPRVAVICDVGEGPVAWGKRSAGGVVWMPLVDDDMVLPPEAAGLLVARPTGTVIMAVHPIDAPRIQLIRVGGRLRIACQLFASTLEKGVLLRSRVRAAIAADATARAQAAAIMESLAAAPPPLTS